MVKAWRRQSIGSKTFDVINLALMLALFVIFAYPFLNVIAISFSNYQNIAKGLVTFFPRGFTIESYGFVMRDSYLYSSYLNTIFYAASHTILMLAITSLVAYPLSKKYFIGNTFVTIYILITMFFNGGLIPTYLNISRLGLRSTIWAMILPGCVSGFNVILFRTFFKNVPEELCESAYMEGASEFRILISIVIPLSKALLATFALFSVVGVWNSWFNALLYLDKQEMYPLQMVLRSYLYKISSAQLQGRAGMSSAINPLELRTIDPKSVQMAMIVITMFPIMAIYPFFQKHFMKGVIIGAIKG